MNDFEIHKRNFGNTSSFRDMYLHLNLRGIEPGDASCIQYDPEEAEITLTT